MTQETLPPTTHAEQPLPTPMECDTSYCNMLDPAAFELEPDQEAMLQNMTEAAEVWDEHLAKTRIRLRSFLTGTATGMSGDLAKLPITTRERDIRQGVQASQVQYTANWHRAARSALRRQVQEALHTNVALPELLVQSDVDELESIKAALKEPFADNGNPKLQPLAEPGYGEPDAHNMFRTVFEYEYAARAALAIAIRTHPEMMRNVLSPDILENTQPSFQRLAALDIRLGVDRSLILQFFSEYINTDTSIESYLSRGVVSELACEILGALSMGTVIRGAPRCPGNVIGLCVQEARKLEPDMVSPTVRTDIVRKQENSGQADVTRLKTFAKLPAHQISKWWQADADIRVLDTDYRQSSKRTSRRGGGTRNGTTESHASLIASTTEREKPSTALKVVTAVWRGNEATIDLAGETAIPKHNLVQSILDSSDYAAYLERFKSEQDALRKVLAVALGKILFTPSYRDESIRSAITKIYQLKPYIDDNRNRYPIWRLSGEGLQLPDGTPSTPASRATRIYFGFRGEGSHRIVQLRRVLHKPDVKKVVRHPGAMS